MDFSSWVRMLESSLSAAAAVVVPQEQVSAAEVTSQISQTNFFDEAITRIRVVNEPFSFEETDDGEREEATKIEDEDDVGPRAQGGRALDFLRDGLPQPSLGVFQRSGGPAHRNFSRHIRWRTSLWAV